MTAFVVNYFFTSTAHNNRLVQLLRPSFAQFFIETRPKSNKFASFRVHYSIVSVGKKAKCSPSNANKTAIFQDTSGHLFYGQYYVLD